MKIKLFITGIVSYIVLLFSFFYYSMVKDFYTSPRLGVYDHKPHVDLLYNTNLHVDPTEINTYLAFFIIASFVLFVSCIMFYKKVYKRILDIIIMSLIYFSLNYSIKIWVFLHSFVVIPYYSAYNSTLYYSNLIIGISMYLILCVMVKRNKDQIKIENV